MTKHVLCAIDLTHKRESEEKLLLQAADLCARCGFETGMLTTKGVERLE